MLNNLLIFRLIIVNACGLAVLVWAYQWGFLQYIAYDSSHISYLIISVFLAGMASLFHRSMKVTRALNAIKAGEKPQINGVKFVAKGDHIGMISSVCVGLGFFGTVVGIISMLFGNGGIATDGSVESISAIIDQILRGGGIAFITTAAGLSTSLWLDLNALILGTATTLMIEDSRDA